MSMNYNPKIKKYIQSLESLSQSTDDYLFVWDIKQNTNWFFGDIDKQFAVREEGHLDNTTEQMLAIVHPADKELLKNDLDKVEKGEKKVHNLNYRWIDRQGKTVWINCRGNVIDDEDGTPMVLIGRVSTSIFESKVNKLTGMFNKRKMLEDSQTTQFMAKDGYVLFLGLDRLIKSYSEHGREYMESIVEYCARLLEEMLPEKSSVYHVEDGVFAVGFEKATKKDVQTFYAGVMEKIQNQCTITAVALPSNKQYFTDERELYTTAIDELVKAKKTRRAKLSFFSKKSVVEQINERLLEEKLENAVNNNFEGFYVCYQPQIRSKTYTIDGVEALMRFAADGEEYSPVQFIPILEHLGLINSAGLWVLKTALNQLLVWRKQIPSLRLNVNFSLSQLSNPETIETVIKIYKETKLPPHVLTVELTESVQVEDVDTVVMATRAWQAAGIDVALDDFGTGYSNLAMLKEIPCNEIKIERTFISHIKENSYGYLLTSSVINFAHQNGICVCCEGVETESDVVTLSPLKPDLYQGYAFDKPCLPAKFEENYINEKSSSYRRRKRLAERLIECDEERATIFDPNEILANIGVGLSVLIQDKTTNEYELHPDKLTANLLGMPANESPYTYNDFWFSRIKKGYKNYVKKNLKRIAADGNAMQFMYPWNHPEKGEIILSFSGVRAESQNDKIVLKGLHRIVSAIERVGFETTSRPLKYFVQNRYMDIILSQAMAFMEINVSKNRVEGGMHDLIGNQPLLGEDASHIITDTGDLVYDEFEKWWEKDYLIKSNKNFLEISNSEYLKNCYDNGVYTIDVFCKCQDKNHKVYDCRKSYFLTKDEFKGDIMALCVIYDISQEIEEKRSFLHRDAIIRTLSDDFKSIMHVNVDEDTVAFYREDTTLGRWYKGAEKHSVMMNIFAERFVYEEDKAEYKYQLSISTMKEKLSKEDEYRFEYRRKCNGTYRYHEVKVKRNPLSEDAFYAIIGVKDIEQEVQLRLQLENALEMAYTDHLTGLYNQQGLLVNAKNLLHGSNAKSALLFMDLDNFKSVNDRYGHGMGDKVLYEVGKALREETRGKDIVGRYGGDEFVVLIYDFRYLEDVEETAERIASRVASVCSRLHLEVNISASIGISYTEHTGYDYHHLKEIADDRLYLAKKRGKNQIVKNSKKN